MIRKENLKQIIERISRSDYLSDFVDITNEERYKVLSKAIYEISSGSWMATNKLYSNKRRAYYFSAEFLMGRAMGNNVINLGLEKVVGEIFDEYGLDYNAVEEAETDAGLGNGGLGRLAACFLDSACTLNLPLMGYGIRYSHGIFKQSFVDGHQVETGDAWLENGSVNGFRREGDKTVVHFDDMDVYAVPYDMPIVGYDTDNVNTLRLWQSEPMVDFDFNDFNSQNYDSAVADKNRAEDISRVLYPNDDTEEGKLLRLKQQYFFVSASLKDIIKRYKSDINKDIREIDEYIAVQLNDTHPVIAIPELMRLLLIEGLDKQESMEVIKSVFAYTNHTILSEALEKWDCNLVKRLIPEVYELIQYIDNEFCEHLRKTNTSESKIDEMRIISNHTIHMAHMAIYISKYVNGVARLHTEILTGRELKDWFKLFPEKFQNKTNGITPRRWIALCNKELSSYITELLDSPEWIKDLDRLEELDKYSDDDRVLNKFSEIKLEKKKELARYILEHEGIDIDVNSIFDIQIKRLHEYKRQLLNAFQILDLYYRLLDNPNLDMPARTFIFGAKAAPGYRRAKGIIKYINEIAKLINNDERVNDKLRVVFVQNYRVSYGEKLFPAADISEQISTAGKEASGTGNMKFMLNGTPTIGTLDGANVEIVEAAGEENNFIFGAKVEELDSIRDSYDPTFYYNSVEGLKRVVDSLIDGSFDDGGTGDFKELHDSLLKGAHWHAPDNYFILKDFADYREAQDRVAGVYMDKYKWARMCWKNIVNAGRFSSDRTIAEYASQIWDIQSNKL